MSSGRARSQRTHGFSLIELLIYVVLMTVVLGALAYITAQVYGLYQSTVAAARADQAASTVLQVFTTEVRSGETIDLAESTFGTSADALTIVAYDGDEEVERRFSITEGRLVYTNDGVVSPLTPADMDVSSFQLTHIVTPVSIAVHVELSLTFEEYGELVTHTYPGLVILRHSYE